MAYSNWSVLFVNNNNNNNLLLIRRKLACEYDQLRLTILKSNQIKSNVGFEEKGKLGYPEKNLSE